MTGCYEEDYEYPGGDISYISVESAVECQKKCQLFSECSYWTWAKPSHATPKECYLKNTKTGEQTTIDTTSGPKFCDGA